VREDGSRDHDQDRCAQHLAEDVRQGAAHRGIGCEDGELGSGVGRKAPVRRVVKGDQCGAAHRAQQLRGPIDGDLRVVASDDGAGERDGGVQICRATAEGLCDQDAAQHAQCPSGGDHHPAGICRIGLAQQDCGVHAVAEEDENERAHELAKPDGVHHSSFWASMPK